MSQQPVIDIRDLKKEFLLSHSGAASLKTMVLWWKRRSLEHFQVLKGIDLQVFPGEAVAVVGRNGAGKSTLLSLLARVYKPTSGNIEVHGKIAPLLELGAGFHPDLSGVENVFFNAVILGLTRKQVAERLDQIIEFSELRSHIDSPVRTYSSGMMARLGFSVAVHVDANILIVDEVLAVGDLDFQAKCYRKIHEFRKEGGSVLFVSHDMASVRKFANRCVWLKDGLIAASGTPDEIIPQYQDAFGLPPEDLP